MKARVSLGLVVGIVVSTAPCALAQTEVGGLICEDTTWDLAGSPYIVVNSIMVGCDATLIIEPGVVLRFKDNLGLTVGHDVWGGGTLVARGTEELAILFTSNAPYEGEPTDPAPGDWVRIYLTDYATDAEFDEFGEYVAGSVLEHVVVEYSGGGDVPAITGESCSPYLAHCEVQHNTDTGMSVNASGAGDVKIQDCVVWDNGGGGIGITAATGGDVNVEYCVVHDNAGGTGISVTGTGGGTVNIDHCQVHDHPNGRGISVAPGAAPVTIEYCEIARCTVGGYGGGIALWAGGADHIVSHNVIEDCVATTNDWHYGGGMYIDARTTLQGNTVSGCTARVGGGIVLWDDSDESTVSGNEITGNTATHWHYGANEVAAGGIYLFRSAHCTLTGNTVTDNTTTNTSYGAGDGGGIALDESNGCVLTQNTVTANTTSGSDAQGGGIYLQDSGSCLIEDNTVTDNSTSGQYAYGGGVCLWSSGTGLGEDRGLRGNTISDNVTTGSNAHGGGVYLESSGSTAVLSNTITGNRVSGVNADAGGIEFANSAGCILESNRVTGNTAADLGGGILFWNSASGELTSNVVTDNTAATTGGIYFGQSGSCTMRGCCVCRNHAAGTPGSTGGIYVYESTWMDFAGDPDTGTYNTICGNDGYCIYNNTTFDPAGSGDIDARYVRWCTDDTQDIQDCIYDYFDDAGKGFVFWYPFVGLEPADMNCDGAVNTFDIDPFVLALTDVEAYEDAYPCCCIEHADCNADGTVNTFDIDPFVALLTGG